MRRYYVSETNYGRQTLLNTLQTEAVPKYFSKVEPNETNQYLIDCYVGDTLRLQLTSRTNVSNNQPLNLCAYYHNDESITYFTYNSNYSNNHNLYYAYCCEKAIILSSFGNSSVYSDIIISKDKSNNTVVSSIISNTTEQTFQNTPNSFYVLSQISTSRFCSISFSDVSKNNNIIISNACTVVDKNLDKTVMLPVYSDGSVLNGVFYPMQNQFFTNNYYSSYLSVLMDNKKYFYIPGFVVEDFI